LPISVIDLDKRFVQNRWTNPVRPRSLIEHARNGKRRAGKLLRVKPERRFLRRIPADRQCAFKRFGGELIAETALISDCIVHIVE